LLPTRLAVLLATTVLLGACQRGDAQAATLPLLPAPPPMHREPLPSVGADTRHALCENGHCLIVDGTGRQFATHAFAKVGPFVNGLAVFERDSLDGRTGVVDAEHGVVLEGRFDRVEVHSNGLIEVGQRAARGSGNASIAFHDRHGAVLRRFDQQDPGDTLDATRWDGLPLVEVCRDDGTPCSTHVLGAQGQTLAEFAQIEPIEGRGLAIASTDRRSVGLVDQQMQWRGRTDYTNIYAYRDGPIVAKQGDYSTVLDVDGHALLPMRDYFGLYPGPTSTLMARLSKRDICLYFHADGTLLDVGALRCHRDGNDDLTLGYQIVETDGHAEVVGLDGSSRSPQMLAVLRGLNRRSVSIYRPRVLDDEPLVGTIWPDGAPQLAPHYRSLAAFRLGPYGALLRDDLLVAEIDDGHGLIDLRGKWVVPARFDMIVPLSHNVIAAGKDGDWQIFDAKARRLGTSGGSPPDRRALIDGTHGFVVRADGHTGLLGEDGHWKVPPQYHDIRVTGQGVVLVSTQDDTHRGSTRLYDLARQTEHPGLQMIRLEQREDGLLEGHALEGGIKHLFTAQGAVIARLPCTPASSLHCPNHSSISR
jgi:hypothetical protein